MSPLPKGCLTISIARQVATWWHIIPADRYHSILIDKNAAPVPALDSPPRIAGKEGADATELLLTMTPAALDRIANVWGVSLTDWKATNALCPVTADAMFAARRAHGVTAPLVYEPYRAAAGQDSNESRLLASLTFDCRSPRERLAELRHATKDGGESIDAFLGQFLISPEKDDEVACRRNLFAALVMVTQPTALKEELKSDLVLPVEHN